MPGILGGKLNILCIIIETDFVIIMGGSRCSLRNRIWNTKSEFKRENSIELSGYLLFIKIDLRKD